MKKHAWFRLHKGVLSWVVSFSKIVLALFGKPGNPGGPELGGLVHQEANINQHIDFISLACLKQMHDTSMDKEAWFTRRP